ncbi:hypothetical protein [Streptomyces sp. NPDC050145]|uniref:hypothetical protein n=1 Tax=Streptomyces sp. NPDC050145 TaxID=3365602 RepID=UPI003789710A
MTETATQAPRLLPPPRRGRPVPGSVIGGLRERAARALRRATPALAVYTAVRVLVLLAVGVWAHRRGEGVWSLLASDWDSNWYVGIADHGYADALGTAVNANNLAFFPLYPVLIKVVAAFTPGSRATVGLALAVLSSYVAAWGIFAVGHRLYGRRVGVLLVFLWACLPVGLVQWMGYTESLFTAAVAWSLYALLTGRWIWAGALCSLAGLTRPTGVALAAAIGLCGLLALRRGLVWRVVCGALLAPLGWLGYVGWVGLRVGRWDGYFAVQKLWFNQVDGGAETLRRVHEILAVEPRPDLFLVMVTLTLFAAVALYGVCVAHRQPLPLLLFTGALLAIVLGSGGVYFPRARFLIPAFPLLLPLALALARASRRVRVFSVAGAVLVAAYGSGYMVLVWAGAP